MGRRGNASRGAMVVLAAIALTACGRGSDPEPRPTVLSGPVGTEYSIHPQQPAQGRLLIAGCCTFATGAARVTKLEGDVDGRSVVGDGFRVELSFGNGLARRVPGGQVTETAIDGVRFRRRVATKAGPGDPDLRYDAIVPLDAAARRDRVREPGLEAKAWCDTPAGCAAAAKLIEGVRF